jgi:Protein of unknown function (DUF1579)
MRRGLLGFTVVCALFVTLEGAQAPPAGPEYAKLEALVGVWRLEGSVKAVPEVGATDAGPVSYTHVNRMINGGFFLETRRTGTGPRGAVSELFVYSYTPASKTYRQDGFGNRGMIRTFTGTIDGRTWTFTGTNTPLTGDATQERFTLVYALDMSSATVRSEHSKDGIHWFERLTGTYTRLSSTVPPG